VEKIRNSGVLNICYLSASTFPSRSANSVQVLSMCKAFTELPSSLTLIGVKGSCSDGTEVCGIQSNLFEAKLFNRPKLRFVGAFIYAISVSFYLLFGLRRFNLYFGRDLLLLLTVPKWGSKFMYESHDEPRKLKLLFENILFKKSGFSGLIVISNALKDFYLSQFPFLRGKIFVAHDGANICVEKYTPINPLVSSSSSFSVGYVGHLYPGKGAEIVVQLAQSMPDIEFHIVGGNDEDIKRLMVMKTQNLTFHGYVNSNKVYSFMAGFDVLVLPAQRVVNVHGGGGNIAKYMSPLKMFEYMSAKKPIIASNLPVLREVLAHNKNCLLVEPDDLNGWMSCISKLKADPGLSSRLASQAFQDLVSNYTWSKRAESIIKYSGVVH
jgi:glycosyltransferase involved in cell wall biosynthesis